MWGQIAAAGIGALGGALSGNQENIGWGDTRPQWAVPWMRDRMADINNLPAPLYYEGQTVADLNPSIMEGLRGLNLYGKPGYGGERARQQSLTAAGRGLGGLGQGMEFLKGYAAQGPNQFGYGQDVFNQTMGNLMPGLQGAYEAGTRDLFRNTGWNQLPGLNMGNVASGQQGGTKQGQASALAQGMAGDRAADIGSNLWMNAANQAQSAAMASGLANLQSSNQFGQDIMRGFGNFAQIGLPFINQAYNIGLTNRQLPLQVGEYMRNFDQQNIDADVARWTYDQNRPWQTLGNKINLANSLIGQPVTPQQTGLDPLSGAIQGLQAGLGIYGAGQNAGWWGTPQTVNQNVYTPNEIQGVDWSQW